MSDRLHRRNSASAYLTDEFGVECAPATLAKLHCQGGGPVVEMWGRFPMYRESDLRSWVEYKLKRCRSTSDRAA